MTTTSGVAREIAINLKVVNDCAERAVQPLTRYLKGTKLTNDEEQRQILLLTVAQDSQTNKLK